VKCTISEIVIPAQRKRTFSEEKTRELADSIKEIGLLQAIVITKDRVLISGLHRLEACKMLGWQEIDYIEKDYGELERELAEIDENLIRAELTALERGEHLKRRKEIYEAKYPEVKPVTVRGGPGRGHKTNEKISPVLSFAEATATKLGVTPRTVQQEVQIATNLAEDVKETIRGTPLEDSKSELLELARKPHDEQRKTVAQLIVSSNSNEWYTPPEYIEAARRVLGEIDLDPASCEEANKIIRAKKFFTAQDDGLQHNWPGKVWLNPPYGGLTAKFVNKLVEQYQRKITTEAILLVNAHATDTDWFQPLWNYVLCFTDHRINFYGPNGQPGRGSTHGSVFVYFGEKQKVFAKEFTRFGVIVRRWYFDD